MPIDDPGWGDFTPPPAGQQPQQPQPQQPQSQQPQPAPQTQPQPQAPPPAQGPSGPSPFADPKVRMVLGGIVALALAAGAYFMFFAGGDDDGDAKPAAAAGENEGDDVPEDGDVGTLPLADYAEIANQVCTSYADDIQAASQAQDLQALAQADQAMLDELMAIPPPDESADLVQGMYSDFQLAIDAIAAGDIQSAQQYATTASTTATQLGFDACAAT